MSTKKVGKQFSDILRPGAATAHATSRPVIAPKHPHIDPVVNSHPAAPLRSQSSRPHVVVLDTEQPLLTPIELASESDVEAPIESFSQTPSRAVGRDSAEPIIMPAALLAALDEKKAHHPNKSKVRIGGIIVLVIAIIVTVTFNVMLVTEYLRLQ